MFYIQVGSNFVSCGTIQRKRIDMPTKEVTDIEQFASSMVATLKEMNLSRLGELFFSL